ncbi:MAG: GreA/GreB family elongation factor [Bacillota bacterium]|nr:GreA/GreB family elongation factor [Bacillota bacterium]
MRVGYSGRPPSPPSLRGRWSPSDRFRRYSAAVADAGLDCVEIPANLLLGKGDWRNQLLAECTNMQSPRAGFPDVQVMMRLGDQHLAEPANAAYARQLAALYGGYLVTMAYRRSRGAQLDSLAGVSDEGGAPFGIIADWHNPLAAAACMEAARRRPGWMVLPSITLGREQGQALAATARRALATCVEANGSPSACLYVAGRFEYGRSTPHSADVYTLVKAALAFEHSHSASISLVFTGVSAAAMAAEAAGMRAALTGDALRLDGRRRVPQIGSRVRIRDVELGADLEYFIVPPEHASAPHGMLSSESPVAKAILGKPCGACVEVSAPGGTIIYELLDVIN